MNLFNLLKTEHLAKLAGYSSRESNGGMLTAAFGGDRFDVGRAMNAHPDTPIVGRIARGEIPTFSDVMDSLPGARGRGGRYL